MEEAVLKKRLHVCQPAVAVASTVPTGLSGSALVYQLQPALKFSEPGATATSATNVPSLDLSVPKGDAAALSSLLRAGGFGRLVSDEEEEDVTEDDEDDTH